MNKYLDMIAAEIEQMEKEAAKKDLVVAAKKGKNKITEMISRKQAAKDALKVSAVVGAGSGAGGYALGKKSKGGKKHTKKANVYLDAVIARLQNED